MSRIHCNRDQWEIRVTYLEKKGNKSSYIISLVNISFYWNWDIINKTLNVSKKGNFILNNLQKQKNTYISRLHDYFSQQITNKNLENV